MRPALISPTKRMGRLMILLCCKLITPASEVCNLYLLSPITDRRPNTAVAGLGISSVSSVSMRDSGRDEMLRELRQDLFAEMLSELLRSQQEIAMGIRVFQGSHSP